MPSFAASLESLLVFLAIVLISAASNWVKQRQAQRQDAEKRERRRTTPEETSTPPPLPSPRVPEATDWDRELRRLFGEEPEPLPSPPPLPRTVAPPPLPRTAPVSPTERPEPARPQVVTPAPIAPDAPYRPIALPAGTHLAPTAEALDTIESPEFTLAPMAESSAAIHRALHLQEEAISRLQRASILTMHHVPLPTAPHERLASPEISRVRSQLRHPRSAREAVLATVILGTPKGLGVLDVPGR